MTTMKDEHTTITAALLSLNEQLQTVATKSIPGLTRILASGGKRQRPTLLFTIVQHYGKAIGEPVISAACAVELVHIASLIHDDILDKGTVRRGVKTISAVEGPETALLAGDYLLAQACSIAARIDGACGQIVADTITQMCKGQSQEITSRYDTSRRPQDLTRSIEGKTASLFIAAALLGGKFAEVDKAELAALTVFAKNYGIAYQLRDDIHDFYKLSNEADKTANYDYADGNYTLPILLALDSPDKLRLKQLLKKNDSHQQIVSLLEAGHYLTMAEAQILNIKSSAVNALGKLSNKKLSSALISFFE